MPRRLRRWRTGYVVSAACVVLGVALIAHGEYGWTTWASFALAPVHAFAATVVRRQHIAHGVGQGSGTDPMPWTTQPSRIAAWFAAERGVARHPDDTGGAAARAATTRTKDRVGATLVAAAAVAGLTLVLTDHDRRDGAHPLDPTPAVAGVVATPEG